MKSTETPEFNLRKLHRPRIPKIYQVWLLADIYGLPFHLYSTVSFQSWYSITCLKFFQGLKSQKQN